jgi:hypothetical protein
VSAKRTAQAKRVATSVHAAGSPGGTRAAGAVRVLVTVRFPELPNVGSLEFDAAWPVETMRRWLTLARSVLGADGPVCAPTPASAPQAAAPTSPLSRQRAATTPMASVWGDEQRPRPRRAVLSPTQIATRPGLSGSDVTVLEEVAGYRGGPTGGTDRARAAQGPARPTPAPESGVSAEGGR